ncbi:MAG TPA: FAD-binding oxidoreductase [Clostridiales bacterium]|nr:FAD-binding oxidoreductase [Clostridiales bacterium]
MSKPYKDYEPVWIKDAPNPRSFRSIMKWGDPNKHKAPKEGLYKLIKSIFSLTDDDFKTMVDTGEQLVDVHVESALTKEQIEAITVIVGPDNATTDDFERVRLAYGKTMIDIMRLRKGIVENVPDIVVYPTDKTQIENLIKYADNNGIKVYVHAGGSSVTRGTEAMISPNIMIDISKNFNKVLAFNEVNQTITVQPGISGPQLEDILNHAPENFGTTLRYTCGHFPQSFEYSCVGGWVVTRGSGQNSTYYGCAADIVLKQEYATPIGTIKSDGAPRKATGPDVDQIMMGSEGCFGILMEVTLKVFRLSKKHKKFSFMFPTWEDGMAVMREVMQGEFGHPSAFRLSDAEETDMMSHMYGIIGSPLEPLLAAKGYKQHSRCLLLGFCDGESGFQRNVYRNIRKIARKYHGLYLTGYVTTSWEHGRFSDPYLRDTIQDYGIIIDTLECAVNWDNMPKVHDEVRAVVKAWPNAICTCHISHSYPQGANLYFIFIIKTTDLDAFKKYHSSILEAIMKSGAALSHHHGIGKLFAPYLEGSIGSEQLKLFKALKAYFDPNNTLNPGGTLALDEHPSNF